MISRKFTIYSHPGTKQYRDNYEAINWNRKPKPAKKTERKPDNGQFSGGR